MELTVLSEQEVTVIAVEVSHYENKYHFRLYKNNEFLQVNFVDEKNRLLSMLPVAAIERGVNKFRLIKEDKRHMVRYGGSSGWILVEAKGNQEVAYVRPMTIEQTLALRYLEDNYIAHLNH
ncbi:hypothetical protein CON65_16010 [Bacillus pseudomycoides]|uniref:Uncharacterized protein n=1 Tax=Bacillus pseudomycoides TaxID=64104 RepID=A0AA91VAK8_9BACI|nr:MULTISPECIES: hypothetical protein [Bacillus]PEB56261.1 hypothetical protein COO03_01445 [Bacillus sp. AFS098217]PED81691.1 hypothetical protein CON65_16010 [Bacillus pseudomycoides]